MSRIEYVGPFELNREVMLKLKISELRHRLLVLQDERNHLELEVRENLKLSTSVALELGKLQEELKELEGSA